MPAPTHYARTIHNSFTAGHHLQSSSSSWASSSPYTPSSHSNILHNLSGIMNKYPPGLGLGEWRAVPGSGSSGGYDYTYNRKRSTPSSRSSSNSRRASPPPPPLRTKPASTTYVKFDPFSDENRGSYDSVLNHPSPPSSSVLYRTPRSSSTRPVSMQYTIYIPPSTEGAKAQTPAPAPAPIVDRNARSKLVAGILLNRVHAVGKPMRRRLGSEPKAYVKSGLSRVVSVEG